MKGKRCLPKRGANTKKKSLREWIKSIRNRLNSFLSPTMGTFINDVMLGRRRGLTFLTLLTMSERAILM